MEKIKKFLQLRKQNDMVKLMLVFLLIGILMLGCAISHGVKVYKESHTPVQYQLSVSAEKITNAELEKIRAVENIGNATMQFTSKIQIAMPNQQESVTCYGISKQYLQSVYGVEENIGMQVFYVTPKCFDRMTEQLNELEMKEGQFQANFQIEMGEETKMATAKFVRLDTPAAVGEDGIFYEAKNIELEKNANEIRIYVEKKDFSGAMRTQIETLGYTIENYQSILENEMFRKEQFLHMKYQIIIALICFLTIKLCKSNLKI